MNNESFKKIFILLNDDHNKEIIDQNYRAINIK